MIEVHHLCKHYGNQKAVDDISFTIEKGHVYGLLGPKGAGKSTTMNILTGCLAASSGDVKIGGFDIFEDPGKAKKRIGYLPENPPLYQEMTVREYLSFVAEAKEVPKEERNMQLEHVMEETCITDVAGRMIRHLSKGYRQRVGIAQALLGNPEVIILDEPTVGLDPRQIIEIRQLIRDLGKNHTVILSSHILSEVRSVCDQILIISKGHLVAGDTPENLEKLFAGNTTIELTARAEDGEIREMLSSVSGIRTISCSAPRPGRNGEPETEVSIETDGAESVSWTFKGENGEESYQLEKQYGIWVWPQDTGLQLDQDAVRSLLQTVENFSAENVFTAGEDSDLSDYGMDNPSCSVTVCFSEESECEPVTILVGDYNSMAYGYYVMVEGDSRIGLTDSTLEDMFSRTPYTLESVEEENESETEDASEE